MTTYLATMAPSKKHKTWPERLGLPNDTPREVWDYRVIDENGREVWAKDLADRYRSELERRQQRDYTIKLIKKGRAKHQQPDPLEWLWKTP